MTTIENSSAVTSSTSNGPEVPHNRFAEAYERYLPEMLALKPEELAPINIIIPVAITTVRAVLPGITALRPEIATHLHTFSLTQFDALEGYALAAAHAQGLYMAVSEPPEKLVQLGEKALELRQIFTADLQALVRRGLIDGAALTEFKGLPGYRNVAFDLLGICSVLRGAWPTIHDRTGSRLEELDQAAEIADQMLTAIAQREQTPAAVTEAALNRQRAYTLMVNAYNQVRRAVGFLRWDEGDADTIAPSFFAARPSHKRKDAPQAPSTPAPQNPAPAAEAPEAAPGAAPVATATSPRSAAVGMPGSHPFGA